MPFEPKPTSMSWNESDVREEIISPLLWYLGYRKGSENDIIREITLRYPKIYLGHFKKSDPDLTGRADYILNIGTHGRWAMDAKRPDHEIDDRDVWQARSYATHPDVAARMYAICNGIVLKLYDTNRPPDDALVLDIPISQIAERLSQVESVLSPLGFKKSFPLPRFDFDKPLIAGRRSTVGIRHGLIEYTGMSPPPGTDARLIEALIGKRIFIDGGSCYRNSDGIICGQITIRAGDARTQTFYDLIGYRKLEFISDDEFIGEGHQKTAFINVMEFKLPANTAFPNPLGGMIQFPFPMEMLARSECIGSVAENKFQGQSYITCYGKVLDKIIQFEQIGNFEIFFDED